ncbi:MAG: hypothetical protein LBK06_05945 [Planctomycetaceae bacterium]|nr:hypothetical protein [Planctomycetaceae bacterium]
MNYLCGLCVLCGKKIKCIFYAKAVLKFANLNTVAQQREAVTRRRSLLPYRLRYSWNLFLVWRRLLRRMRSILSLA